MCWRRAKHTRVSGSFFGALKVWTLRVVEVMVAQAWDLGWEDVGLGLLDFLCMGWSEKKCKTWVPGSWLDGNGTFA